MWTYSSVRIVHFTFPIRSSNYWQAVFSKQTPNSSKVQSDCVFELFNRLIEFLSFKKKKKKKNQKRSGHENNNIQQADGCQKKNFLFQVVYYVSVSLLSLPVWRRKWPAASRRRTLRRKLADDQSNVSHHGHPSTITQTSGFQIRLVTGQQINSSEGTPDFVGSKRSQYTSKHNRLRLSDWGDKHIHRFFSLQAY